MSIKELFFSSFIQGIGKTTGTVTILGFLGCAWYIQMNYLKEQEQVQEQVQVQAQAQAQAQEQVQLDLEQIENIEYNTQKERNYKKLFQKLL